ncbi:hypothetical protein SAMN04487944_11313 [Gracilibacillus ureilyticus]|uniref:Uncharacterized protein n=1 Tax=Gracilibacillus ureilyticus TaxID=531814 RepID=A0A1H9T6Q5_9BACI|nr:hypothetical protein [Gracilibacillus ureilyticus]SER92935.1 hypothetical protein SAMN04487944_11313 [Gracilibacillus ureilyticus]
MSNGTYDKYMKAFLHIFTNHSKLKNYLTEEYVDLHDSFIDVERLQRDSKTWSRSEKFLLELALHVYTNNKNIDINEIDILDHKNKMIVRKAFEIRFGW